LGFSEVLPEPLREALEKVTRIPTYGERGAGRLVYNLLKLSPSERREVVEALARASDKLRSCSECYLITDGDLCRICADPKRNKSFICVVEESQDAYAVERLGRYRGVYHVLQGRIAPLEGISPQDLTIDRLVDRVRRYRAKEVIVATNPNAEGEATANYLIRLLKERFPKLKVSRISYGLQFGSVLEFADEVSLEKSFENRK
jgi:recombination protein RecR